MSLPIVRSTPSTVGSFIDEHCATAKGTTTIIACCTRQRFLEEITIYALSTIAVLKKEEVTQPPPSAESSSLESEEEPAIVNPKPQASPLLQPTLGLLAASLSTNIVFCPDIPSFRVYVSTYPLRQAKESKSPTRLVVLDMLALHIGTSDFTIQGLSRTFAMLASVNHQMTGMTEVIECNDFHDPDNQQRGPGRWNAEVALLSGSIKIGEAGQGWANRTTSIRSFAERWFQFE